MRYKLRTGSFAWAVHRLTGIALTLYIFLHLYVLAHLKDPEGYASIMEVMQSPLVKLSEAGLLALVIAHAFNGFRLTLLDLGMPTGLHKSVFWSAFAIGAVISVLGGVIIAGVFP
ncbi:MAG: succinate dehydrogenase, cytochrome b556 subunit [Candidatus Sulfobium sp.]|jgi:succinate dehydrogenase / fumarate reductase cytochrome b subunit